MKKIKYSNAKMIQGLKRIVKEIDKDEFEFDYIVGLVRGGAVPAVYLSNLLVKPVYLLPYSCRDNMLSHGNVIPHTIMSDLNAGKKILLVDDIVDTGKTIHYLYEEFKNRKTDMAGIKLCALHYNENNKYKITCDYFHEPHNDGTWIVYNWEL